MPLPEEKTAAPDGISSSEAVDVEALFARLKDELVRGGGDDETPAARRRPPPRPRAARLGGERGAFLPPPGRGSRVAPLRKLMRWYVEPLAAEQRAFNDAVLKLIDDLYETADRARRRGGRHAHRSASSRNASNASNAASARPEPRPLLRPSPPSPPRPPSRTTSPSRAGCAARPDTVRARQRPYVDDFRDAAPVLDVGCGRGEFLGLLREAGVEARGVDADADMVAFARGEGLDVEQADALAYLESLEDGSLGGIFAGAGRRAPAAGDALPAARARRRQAPARAACSWPRRSTRSRRSRSATTSPT